MTAKEIAANDVAEMDLHCSDGLPGIGPIDYDKEWATLNEWVAKIEQGIKRLCPTRHHPDSRHFTPAQFKLPVMVTILQRDLGVHYEDPTGFEAGDPSLRRYVGNRVLSATDPTGLTIEYAAAIIIAKDTDAKHRKEVDAVVAKAIAVLKALDINLKVDFVIAPNIITEERLFGFANQDHGIIGTSTAGLGDDCAKFLQGPWKDKDFLRNERKNTKAKNIIGRRTVKMVGRDAGSDKGTKETAVGFFSGSSFVSRARQA